MKAHVVATGPQWRLWAPCLALSVLAGCAQISVTDRIDKASAALAATSECCQKAQELRKEPLPVLKPVSFTMDATRPVFRIGPDKSYVLAFELPRYDKPYSITVSSLTQGLITDSWLFVPRVTLLDERSLVTRTFPEDSLRTRGRAVERTVFINPSNAAERYLVVHAAALNSLFVRDVQSVTTQSVVVGPGMIANWTSGADVRATTRSAPIGEIEVSVEGLAPPVR
jgi:hypothetical protein